MGKERVERKGEMGKMFSLDFAFRPVSLRARV